MSYEPKPIDTSAVTLADDILHLTELLARSAHDVWARQRLNDGWRHGLTRDDVMKTHPCLVPYEELPESEKTYDRNTAMQTIKAIKVLGYDIEARLEARDAADQGSGAHPDLKALRRLLVGPPEPKSAAVIAFWQAQDHSEWKHTPEFYRLIAGWLIKNGDPLQAFDVASEGLQFAAHEPRLRQLQGLALARTGATEVANEVLGKLRDEGHSDEETLGILARTHKDLGLAAAGVARLLQLKKSRDLYDEAHRRNSSAYWTGINVATLSLLLGESGRARSVATAVEQECLEALNKAQSEGTDTYWILATLGEAALVQNERNKALHWYGLAVAVSRRRWGDVSSTRRQARLILECLDGDHDAFEQCLRIPAVVVFAGHMTDSPERTQPRFPASLETTVKDAIRERLSEVNVGYGYSSCARGSDILFQEALRELHAENNLLLPYRPEEFIPDSVGPGTGWEQRFHAVQQHANWRSVASPYRLTWGGITYDYANLLLLGRALMHADQLQTDLIPLAVWDGNEGDGPGGTASIVDRWRRLGHTVELVNMAEILARHGHPSAANPHVGVRVLPPMPAPARPPMMPEIKAILCADVKNFSQLTEEQIVAYSERVLQMIGEIATHSAHAPRVRNTWGDGLFCVFDTAEDAGLFALELRDGMRRADWKQHGLPHDLMMRIALHAGPIFQCVDPVTSQPTYLGAHVNYAARIEPITPAGEIYASWAFAAQARAGCAGGFACDYAGRIVSARLTEPIEAYRVRRD